MAEHVWSVLCYKGVIDKFTNQVSLLDVIEAFNFEEVPQLPPESERPEGTFFRVQAQVVSLWVRSQHDIPETVRWRVAIRLPTGKIETGDTQTEADLSAGTRGRSILQFPVLPFAGMGTYWFDVQAADGDNWITKASIPVELRLRPQRSTEVATGSAEAPAAPAMRKTKRNRRRK